MSPSFTCHYHVLWQRQLLQDYTISVPGLLLLFMCPCVWSTIWLSIKFIPLLNTLSKFLMLENEELSKIHYVFLWCCFWCICLALSFFQSYTLFIFYVIFSLLWFVGFFSLLSLLPVNLVLGLLTLFFLPSSLSLYVFCTCFSSLLFWCFFLSAHSLPGWQKEPKAICFA